VNIFSDGLLGVPGIPGLYVDVAVDVTVVGMFCCRRDKNKKPNASIPDTITGINASHRNSVILLLVSFSPLHVTTYSSVMIGENAMNPHRRIARHANTKQNTISIIVSASVTSTLSIASIPRLSTFLIVCAKSVPTNIVCMFCILNIPYI
jgi:hypothetical protein